MTVRCIYCASICNLKTYIFTHTHPFNGPLSRTTRVSRYQKGKTNLDFTEATDSEWQWHQLGHKQVCTLLQTDNHTSTSPLCLLCFLQAGCPSCRPTYIFNKNKKVNTCIFKLSTASNDRQNLSDISVLRHTLLCHLANTHASDTSLCAWLLWTLLHYSTSKLYIVA